MKQNPFTNNPKKRIEKMDEAVSLVQQAIKALNEARKCSGDWAEYGTLGYHQLELVRFLSCDNGEAGLKPYLDKVKGTPVSKRKRTHKAFNRSGQLVTMSVPED